MRRLPPLYPLFIPAAWIILFFVVSPHPSYALWRPLALIVAASAIVYAVAAGVLRDRQVGAFVAAIVICSALAFWIVALPLLALGGAWQVLRLRRRLARHPLPPLRFERFSEAIGIVSAVFLGLAIANGVLNGAFATYGPPGKTAIAAAVPAGSSPDIYLIMLDGYPNLATTATEFGIDNEPFARALADLGFDVSRGSRSNYTQTWTTLASMFWMRYVSEIPDLAPPPGSSADQFRALTKAINTGPALAMLRERGYRIISSPSALSDTALRAADEVLDDGFMTDFEEQVLRLVVSPLGGGEFLRSWVPDQARGAIEASFAHIPRVLDEVGGQPIFMLDHVLSPHPPFLYRPDGTPRDLPPCYPQGCIFWSPIASDLGLSRAEYADGLRDQLAYLNGLTVAAVREIIERDPSAVILVFSDHGTRNDPADRPEYFESFLAARTPGHPSLFGEAPSPVNYMPALFNAYFGMSLPTQAYHAWWWSHAPLDLEEFDPSSAPS